MYKTVPIFPLQLVVYPTEILNLHIFEPRYKELIQDCQRENLSFGIPAFIDDKIMSIGTEVRISTVHKVYEDGRMDISAEGIRVFRISEVYQTLPDKLYSGAKIEDFPTSSSRNLHISNEILVKISELFKACLLYTSPSPRDA